MNPTVSPHLSLFTCSRLRLLLGLRSRSTVPERLQGVEPADFVECAGRSLPAYRFADLPPEWREVLMRLRDEAGFRDVTDLAQADLPAWQPSVPCDRFPPAALDRARRLREALLPFLMDEGDGLAETEGEFIRRGCAAYKAVFKHEISEASWQEAMRRTRLRDRFRREWTRLDIYLPDMPVPDNRPQFDFAASFGVEDLLKNGELTPEGKVILWVRACETVNRALQAGCKSGAARRMVCGMIVAAIPSIYSPQTRSAALTAEETRKRAVESVARTLANKLAAYDGSPESIADRRAEASGNFRAPVIGAPKFAEFRARLLAIAAKHGGGLDAAWRMGCREGWVPDEFLAHYKTRGQCPNILRRQMRDDVNKLRKRVVQAPRAAALAGNYIERIPDSGFSGEGFEADDLTPPVIFWEDTPDGLWVGQGQFIGWCDVRSAMWLGYALVTSNAYTAASIAVSLKKVILKHGKPENLRLERGIWERSRLITGGPKAAGEWNLRTGSENSRWISRDDPEALLAYLDRRDRSLPPVAETEYGLRRICPITHCYTPGAKTIERHFRTLQDEMQLLRGFTGRDPFKLKNERTYRNLALVRSGKAHPAEFFLSKAEVMAAYDKRLADLNETPRRGPKHRGLTPSQAWAEFMPSGGLHRISQDEACLLLTPKIPVHRTRNGIRVPVGNGGRGYNYKGAAWGPLPEDWKGFAYFDPESPESCAFTDADGKNPFVLEWAEGVRQFGETEAQMQKEQRLKSESDQYTRNLYRTTRPIFAETTARTKVTDPATAETIRLINTDKREIHARRREDNQQRRSSARKLAAVARQASSKEAEPRISSEQIDTLARVTPAEELSILADSFAAIARLESENPQPPETK